MSVQSNTYVMLGFKLDLDRFTSEQIDALEAYRDSAYSGIEHKDGVCVVIDHEAGHLFAGTVRGKSDDQNGNYGFNEPIAALSDENMKHAPHVWKNVVAAGIELLSTDEPNVWIFTSYR